MTADARACFLRACGLDVAVRKPGNVSLESPGHGMSADQFIASAQAASGTLFRPGARVGDRIEDAVAASWAATGCNTNLGILLLCAPIAAAFERDPRVRGAAALRRAIEGVLADLDVQDAAAAYRGIALANPGGLGGVASQDVREAPTVGLREAMALAAERDLIARQYRDGYAILFDTALPALPPTFALGATPADSANRRSPADAATTAAVQRLYLTLLGGWPDSHIVRKHGEALAQNVMRQAQPYASRARTGEALGADPAFIAWDDALKARRINPGTTADLTVATLMLAGLAEPSVDAAGVPV